jgi:hypothetical protein
MMDKITSILAALEAGKLPATEQLCHLIDWVDKTILPQIEPSVPQNLTPQGALLAKRLRQVLSAYKAFFMNKDGDNMVQEAIWHLTQGEITTPGVDTATASEDVATLRSAVRSIMSIAWASISTESSTLLNEFASFTRLSLADAAELIESGAGSAKESLREIEHGVQKGERTAITGRDRARVEEEEKDVKAKWEHGVEAVKAAGDTVIDTTRAVSTTVEEKAEKVKTRSLDAYLKICDHAQSDPEYREAVESLLNVLEKRTHQALDTASPDALESLFEDTSPEKHLKQALSDFQTFFERLSSYPLSRLIARVRVCLDMISRDSQLRNWFDEFFALARKNLTEPGYVRTEESQKKRQELRQEWNRLMEKEEARWQKAVEAVKTELSRIQDGLNKDRDIQRLKEAHAALTQDLERGLVEAGEKAEMSLESLVERATWFWQDLFKVYIPHLLSELSHIPIPRTEYKDSELEFVLENLDISSLNILPSHVYIRNITDIDMKTAESVSGGTRTSVGTLTRVKIDAIQLTLRDVSFWYKDLTASALSPAEFSGLLGLSLPPQGISLDFKVRLIPSTIPASHPVSRAALGHFHVIEFLNVSISEDVKLEVKDSNHPLLLSMFKPIFMMRLREALERTLTQQIHALMDWTDGVAWDVGQRKEVLEDTGTVSGGAALLAAVWSEIGKFRRERRERGAEVRIRPTGTGIIVEQKDPSQRAGDVSFAIGAEPQILSGEKRGPLGTGSEPLSKKLTETIQEATGVDVGQVVTEGGEARPEGVKRVAGQAKEQAKGFLQETKMRAESFYHYVELKKDQEMKKPGWRSDAFDI